MIALLIQIIGSFKGKSESYGLIFQMIRLEIYNRNFAIMVFWLLLAIIRQTTK